MKKIDTEKNVCFFFFFFFFLGSPEPKAHKVSL